jgi:hypothetical protein
LVAIVPHECRQVTPRCSSVCRDVGHPNGHRLRRGGTPHVLAV